MNMDWQMITVCVILVAVAIRIGMGIRDNMTRGKGALNCTGCALADQCMKKGDQKECKNKPGGNSGCGCGCH